jgi:S-adenosylmethionine hydrolase
VYNPYTDNKLNPKDIILNGNKYMPIITLTTDFGTKDGFVGTLKGVIWRICPDAQIADITHDVSPQNILEGAYALWRAYPFFPPGTIHIAVVDPGVGTQRRSIALRFNGHTFVGPDNGLFTPMLEDAEKKRSSVEIVHLINEKYFLPNVSHTFHGRDIFSPIAAHLANGIPLADLGPAIHDPVYIPLPKPEKTSTGWRAHVTVVDVFGNCTTDLPASEIVGLKEISFKIHGYLVNGLVGSYGQKMSDELVALVDSENYVEIAMVNNSAARKFKVQVGDIIEVTISSVK